MDSSSASGIYSKQSETDMIDAIVHRFVLSGTSIRRLIGQYKDVKEFLSDTYGTVTIETEIRGTNPWNTDYPKCSLYLNHVATRNDKVPILTEGMRRFEELMITVSPSDYSDRNSIMKEDIMLMALQRKRYIEQFYGRNAIVLPIR